MPKTAKSPVKPRPKPKSPKKPALSSPFVDDEAEESDEGVLVDHPTAQPTGSQQAVGGADVRDTDLEDDYEESFINDGDPSGVDDNESDVSTITPPPSPSKPHRVKQERRTSSPPANPSPLKRLKRAAPAEEVIDIETSDEDLEAMDVDDSVFRKPAGVKPSALPPSLVTRSVASKRSDPSSEESQAPDSAPNKTGPSNFSHIVPPAIDPPPGMGPEMTAAMTSWMNSFMAAHVQSTGGNLNGPSYTPPVAPTPPQHVDFDQLELEKGLKASLEQPVKVKRARASAKSTLDSPVDLKKTPVSRKSKGKGKAKARSPSPDWDPPYAGEILTPPPPTTPSPSKRLAEFMSNVVIEPSGSGRTKPIVAPFPPKRAPTSAVDGDVTTFFVKPTVPVASSSGGNAKGGPPLTMAQFLRQSRGEPEPEGGDEPEKEAGPSDDQDQSSTVFLEDIETYRAYFDATAKCGVFDLSIQDKSLRPGYIGLHPLPAFRRILAAYDRNRISGDDTIDYTTGGRIQFSSWFRQLPRMIAANSMGAMMFQESEPNFINPSRISPLRLSTQGSAGSSTTQRLHVNGRIAVCVTPVCVTESHVVVPRKIGLKSDRRRKWISGVPHDQDWERMEALLCLLFHETIMYGQIADKSLSFQTMISPETAKQSDSTPDRFTRGVPSSMFSARSPAKNSPGSSFQASKAKTLLAFDDTIPVYDARKTVIDFDADLDRLGHVLPLFIGEVPNGSFAIIGYSVSSYFGNILSKANKVPYIGMNLLWVIVCGVPA